MNCGTCKSGELCTDTKCKKDHSEFCSSYQNTARKLE